MDERGYLLSKAWLREIGAKLKEARKQRKMTQEDLAKAAGVHRPYISKIETGEYDLKVSTLGRLCSALAMSIEITSPKGYGNKKMTITK